MIGRLTWFALYTRPRYEMKVNNELVAMGIEAYLPVQKTLKKWSDRKKWIEEPLFKSYCFVRIAPELYRKPLDVIGAIRYIYLDGKPAKIRDSEIEAIKMICDSNFPVEVVERDFIAGEKISITSGPLRGLEGEFIEGAGKQKVLVRIDSINHGLLVSVPIAQVMAC